jgi:hypothetical protein
LRSITFVEVKVAPVTLQDANFIRKLVLLPVRPTYFLEKPFLAQMRRHHSVLILVASGYEFVEESEELVDLLLGKVSVVAGVFHFKSVGVLAFSGHDVGQRVEAGVADWNAHGAVTLFLEELDEHGLAVEASLAPPTKFNFINFLNSRFLLSLG